MKKLFIYNFLVNVSFGIIFVGLNMWALNQQLEETFVSLAIIYAMITVVMNMLFILISKNKV